jgi:hypothetical protein
VSTVPWSRRRPRPAWTGGVLHADSSDTAGSDSRPGDTGDTAGSDSDSGDTGAPDTGEDSGGDSGGHTAPDSSDPPADPHWDATLFGHADLTIAGCGTDDVWPYTLAFGPDLDGDGLAELALGSRGTDAAAFDVGTVYFVRGSDLVAGADVFTAWASVTAPLSAPFAGFATDVQWVGDGDGDGVDDLLVFGDAGTSVDDVAWVVSGADLAAGGTVAVAGAEIDEEEFRVAAWDDVDGDGVADWAFAMPNRGMAGPGNRGALGAVSDVDFDLSGTPARIREVYGQSASAHAGSTLAALDGDYDGDGIRELAVSLDADTVVVNSGAMLAWATYVDELVRWRFTGMDATDYPVLVALGDVDGGGRDDLLFLDPGQELCIGRGEDADETAGTTRCFDLRDLDVPLAVVGGDDLDGDGVPDLWGRTSDGLVALSIGALASGTVSQLATITAERGHSLADVAVSGGLVWTSAVFGVRAPADAVWGFAQADGLAEADATVVVSGGGWGASPEAPDWLDVTGDGVTDLVFQDDGAVAVFEGTGLASGGTRTLCDAEYSAWLGEIDLLEWLDDLDGDGAADVLVTTVGDSDYTARVVSGRTLIGLESAPDVATWTNERLVRPVTGCDLDGDGRDDLASSGYKPRGYYAGSVLTSGDLDAAWLGDVTLSGAYGWCVPDVDGDGRDDLVLRDGSEYPILRSSQLDPAATLTSADAWATLTDDGTVEWTSPVTLGDLDGDGTDDSAWKVQLDVPGSVYALCLFDETALAAGGELALADAALACAGEWDDLDLPGLADVTGDGAPDVVVYADNTRGHWSLYAIDGTDFTAAVELLPVSSAPDHTDESVSSAGSGADVLGAGAPALWVAWHDRATYLATVEVLFGER